MEELINQLVKCHDTNGLIDVQRALSVFRQHGIDDPGQMRQYQIAATRKVVEAIKPRMVVPLYAWHQ